MKYKLYEFLMLEDEEGRVAEQISRKRAELNKGENEYARDNTSVLHSVQSK